MPHTAPRTARLGLVLLALAFVCTLAVPGAQGSEGCSASGPLVCLSVTASPQTVSPSRPGSPTYISYAVLVSNDSGNTVNHVTLTGSPPGGSGLVSVTPSVGTCASSGLSCALGSLRNGATASAEVVVTAPAATGDALATFTVSFDEGPNDNGGSDPKQDTVSTTETVTVAATPGVAASFVPEGGSVDLSTDPSGTGIPTTGDPLLADAAITAAPTSITALIEETSGPLSCPKGVVCRRGDWLQAAIPGTFDPPLAFLLRWDKSLISSGFSAKKSAVLLTECLSGCPIQIVKARCASATPALSELPCLWNVVRKADGDWVTTLFNSHNGYIHG
jgi:hypothetical protein